MSGKALNNLLKTESGRREFLAEELILSVTERICELMQEKSISRAALAEKLGVSKPRITKLLSGETNMTLRTLSDIFVALGRAAQVRDCSQGEFFPQREPATARRRISAMA